MKNRRCSVAIYALIFGVWILSGCSSPRENTPTLILSDAIALENGDETSTSTLTPFQPNTQTPTITLSPTIPPTPSVTPSPTASETPLPSNTPTATVTPTPLTQAQIEKIRGRWPSFSLSCEARSAVDWAAYFGTQISEVEFQSSLPLSDDPDRGFVGNVRAPWGQIPPNPYGVHADPVADLLRDYGLNAQAVHGMTWDALRSEISAGRPVIVWVVGRVGLGTPVPYTSSAGRDTTVVRFEHTVILTGYTQRQVTVLDGYWVYTRPLEDFLDSWRALGNMAVVWVPD